MAKKDQIDESAIVDEPVVSQHVRIVNLASGQRQFSLTDGTTVACGPKAASSPLLRKLVGPTLRALEKRGIIRIERVGGE